MTLYEKLLELNKSDMYPLHMPGHKRSAESGAMSDFYGIDITEIDGFDDLHAPEGIIKKMQDDLAKIYGAGHAFISVNGSTAANEAAVLAACGRSGKVLLARNCHKSVYYALELTQAEPVYIVPETVEGTSLVAPLTVGKIEEKLKNNPDCKTVIISSPTYDGITADVAGIAETVHKFDGVLIVDCAHGAHFGFDESLPETPVRQGADYVIMSLHKMLPAPTQTAVLFTCTDRADDSKAEHYMNVFQSSSPSYILMAGIGECIKYLGISMSRDVRALSKRCDKLRSDLKNLRNISIQVPESTEFGADRCKLIISSVRRDVNGRRLYDILKDNCHVQCEMYGADYTLGLLTVMDDEAGFKRIGEALLKLDRILDKMPAEEMRETTGGDSMKMHLPERVTDVRHALFADTEDVKPDTEACGRIAAAYITVYPPGIPIVIPGEQIDEAVISYINRGLEQELNIQGLREGRIPVVIGSCGK